MQVKLIGVFYFTRAIEILFMSKGTEHAGAVDWSVLFNQGNRNILHVKSKGTEHAGEVDWRV